MNYKAFRKHRGDAVPQALFDADWYSAAYPDAASFGDPLRHYLEYGCNEGRAPTRNVWLLMQAVSEVFDADWYCRAYPDVVEAGADPLEHYLQHGCAEGRHPTIGHARAAAWVRTFGTR